MGATWGRLFQERYWIYSAYNAEAVETVALKEKVMTETEPEPELRVEAEPGGMGGWGSGQGWWGDQKSRRRPEGVVVSDMMQTCQPRPFGIG